MKTTNEAGKIYVTKNYSRFKFGMENRSVSSSHVKELMQKMEKYGYLRCQPIVVDKNTYQIIDGQHRFEAAKMLGIEFSYTFNDYVGSKSELIRDINVSQKAWGIQDYIEQYCGEGNMHYISYKTILTRYGCWKPCDKRNKCEITNTIVNLVVNGGYNYVSYSGIKSGKLVCLPDMLNTFYEELDYLNEVFTKFKQNRINKKTGSLNSIAKAVLFAVRNGADKERLLEHVFVQHANDIHPVSSTQSILNQIDTLYNIRLKKNRISLEADWLRLGIEK